jgi:hypothetical protein
MEKLLGFTNVEAQQMNLFKDLVEIYVESHLIRDEAEEIKIYDPVEKRILERMDEGLKGGEVLNFRTKVDRTETIVIYIEYSYREGLNNCIDGFTLKSAQVIFPKKEMIRHREKAKLYEKMAESLRSSLGTGSLLKLFQQRKTR